VRILTLALVTAQGMSCGKSLIDADAKHQYPFAELGKDAPAARPRQKQNSDAPE
jgi:hypothetical protein